MNYWLLLQTAKGVRKANRSYHNGGKLKIKRKTEGRRVLGRTRKTQNTQSTEGKGHWREETQNSSRDPAAKAEPPSKPNPSLCPSQSFRLVTMVREQGCAEAGPPAPALLLCWPLSYHKDWASPAPCFHSKQSCQNSLTAELKIQ